MEDEKKEDGVPSMQNGQDSEKKLEEIAATAEPRPTKPILKPKKKKVKKRITSPSRLEKKYLSNKDHHIEEYHGREQAWPNLTEDYTFNNLCKRYVKSLENKCIIDRVNYIESRLRQHQYQCLDDFFGPIEKSMKDNNGTKLQAGRRYYIKFQNRMVIPTKRK